MSVAFLSFFPSSLASTPNGLAGHLELITSTSVNCFNCHERAVKREYIFSLSLIICQTFLVEVRKLFSCTSQREQTLVLLPSLE